MLIGYIPCGEAEAIACQALDRLRPDLLDNNLQP